MDFRWKSTGSMLMSSEETGSISFKELGKTSNWPMAKTVGLCCISKYYWFLYEEWQGREFRSAGWCLGRFKVCTRNCWWCGSQHSDEPCLQVMVGEVHKETRWLSQGYSKIMLNYRDINLLTKVHSVKVMVLPVVMYGCENWTIKKVKQKRIEAFNLWCWRRVLRVPWITRWSNQSILKEINSECSLTDAEAEAPVLWPPDAKSQLIGKDWRQKEKGTAEDEMVR